MTPKEPTELPATMVPGNGGSRPIPDPTVLTAQLVDRAVIGIREILEAKIDGDRNIFATRLQGMDRAIELLQARRDSMVGEIDGKIANLERLHDEKFRSVQTQFTERDIRAEQTSRDSKVAVDAALQAAKEAVGKQNEASDRSIQKSEVSTTKQIDEQGRRVDDLKERLTRLESEGRGSDAAKTTQQTSNASSISIISVVVAVVGLIGGFLIAFLNKGP